MTKFIKSVLTKILLISFLGAIGSNSLVAGEPPFPADLAYPNVILPDSQFGSLGDKMGLFNTPRGVSFNETENTICVADTLNNRIQLLNIAGNPVVRDNHLLITTEFGAPHDVDCDDINFVAVAEVSNKRIAVIENESVIRYITGFSDNVKLINVEVSMNSIYVLDNANNEVIVMDKKGNDRRRFGNTDNFSGKPLSNPLGLALDQQENIYISDSDNSRIVKLDKNGNFIDSWGTWGSYSGNLAGAAGLDVIGNRVFVADQINHRIQVFDTSGSFLFQWGRHPSVKHAGNGRVHYPYTIAAASEGDRAIVCEPFEHRCQIFSVSKAERLDAVNDSAWWQKATMMHYGTGAQPTNLLDYYQRAGCKSGPAINLFSITEPDTHAALIFDYSNDLPKLIAVLGGYGDSENNFIRPSGAAFLPDGSIFISDSGNRRISLYNQNSEPDSLSMDGARVTLSQPSYRLNAVRRISFENNSVESNFNGEVMEPGRMAIGPDCTLYVLLPKDKKIAVMSMDLEVLDMIDLGKDVNMPLNFEISNDLSSFYVVDHYGYQVLKYSIDGKLITKWGKSGSGRDEFTLPFGIAISANNTIYISDVGQNRIKAFNSDGKFLFQWGSWGTETGEFYKPKGMAIDRKGHLIVNDFGNHRGQIFDLSGKGISEFGIGAGYKAVRRP